MPNFEEAMKQMQQFPQQMIDTIWWFWLISTVMWAAYVGIAIYVFINVVALIRSVIRFIDAKSDQVKKSSVFAGGFGTSPELHRERASDSDARYRPRG